MHFKVNELKIRFFVWYPCDQEIYRSLISSFYRNSSLAIIVYDVSSKESFESLDIWIKEFKKKAICDLPFFIVGNIDDSKRNVSIKEAKIYSVSKDAKYFTECSYKTGFMIKDIFFKLQNIYMNLIKTFTSKYC